jgi:cyclopropane fatty-acyl-phospholipid synthase-like methyltransferase
MWPATALDTFYGLMTARARLADEDRILELGCDWSSLSLRMAQRLPNSNITAVSNPRNAEAVYRGACRCPGVDLSRSDHRG